MSDDPDTPPEGTSAVVSAHSLSKNLKDKFIHFVKTDSDQCPKCGMHGAISKGECQSCGCWIEFNNEKAGTKVPLESMQKPQKPQKSKKQKPAAKKPEEEEEQEEPQEEDEDIEVEAATVKPRDLALALVKKAKGVLKESAGLIGEHFSELVITFDPFVVKLKEKPKAIDI